MNDAGQYDETVNGAAMGASADSAPYEACPGVSDDSPTVIGAPVQSAPMQSAPMQIQGAVPVADAVPYGASYAAPVQGAAAQLAAPQPVPQQAFAQQQAGFVPQMAGGAAVPASMAPANGIAPGVSQPGVSQYAAPQWAAPRIASQEFISQDLSRLAQTSGAAKEQFLAAYNAGYDVELPGDVARRAAESRRVASMSGNGAATPAPVAPYAQNGAPYAAPYGVSPANVAPPMPQPAPPPAPVAP
ncbi:hypothetical protein ACLUXB_06960, partial [Pseudoscardovia radai]